MQTLDVLSLPLCFKGEKKQWSYIL